MRRMCVGEGYKVYAYPHFGVEGTAPRGVARNLIWVGINGPRRHINHIKELRYS